MKKVALFVTALSVSLSLGGRALADTNIETFADKAGITADNTILYPIDKALDDLKVSLASGEDKEAEALMEVAEERLGESEVLAEGEKADLVTEAVNEYNDKMAEAQDKIEEALDKVSETDNGDNNNTTTGSAISSDELNELEKTIADKQLKSIEVLKNVESKLSGNAKETLALVIEMQTRKKEAIVAVAKERQAFHESKELVKVAEKSLKEAKKSGDEEAVKAAEENLAKAKETLTTQKEKLNKAVAEKKKAMKGGVGQLKKQAEKEQTEKAVDSSNTTTSEEKNTTIEETSSKNTQTTTTTKTVNPANSTTGTNNESTVNNNATGTNSTKADKSIKENKVKEIKSEKEDSVKQNKGQEMKANKENSSSHENKSRE